jgi:hypothetical protein
MLYDVYGSRPSRNFGHTGRKLHATHIHLTSCKAREHGNTVQKEGCVQYARISRREPTSENTDPPQPHQRASCQARADSRPARTDQQTSESCPVMPADQRQPATASQPAERATVEGQRRSARGDQQEAISKRRSARGDQQEAISKRRSARGDQQEAISKRRSA